MVLVEVVVVEVALVVAVCAAVVIVEVRPWSQCSPTCGGGKQVVCYKHVAVVQLVVDVEVVVEGGFLLAEVVLSMEKEVT